ncbi:MAG: hypothetical protein NVS1B2_11620 [Vulcanimicrobiaceae bacterium]
MADVVVVGAGPAGSACALALARAGIDVTIVERHAFPRRKVCGEYLNGGAVRALGALGALGLGRTIAARLGGGLVGDAYGFLIVVCEIGTTVALTGAGARVA